MLTIAFVALRGFTSQNRESHVTLVGNNYENDNNNNNICPSVNGRGHTEQTAKGSFIRVQYTLDRTCRIFIFNFYSFL